MYKIIAKSFLELKDHDFQKMSFAQKLFLELKQWDFQEISLWYYSQESHECNISIITRSCNKICNKQLSAQGINSLWPNGAIWRQRSESTLAQVMACCLMAPSHYLNQCWLIIRKSSDIHIMAILEEMPQPSITKILHLLKQITVIRGLTQ